MDCKTEIVTDLARLKELLEPAPEQIIADVETKGKLDAASHQLLGIALAFRDSASKLISLYVPFWGYFNESVGLVPFPGDLLFQQFLSEWLPTRKLIGHSIEYDRPWIDETFGIQTTWIADTRKMWQLADNKDLPHGFGLKTAQKDILKWEETNEVALAREVEERGGKLSAGDHYLASVGTLGHYACLDVVSTLLVFEHFVPFFDKNDYWEFMRWRLDYHKLLTESTRRGMIVDVNEMTEAEAYLAFECIKSEVQIREVCAEEIYQWEAANVRKKVGSLKRAPYAMEYLRSPEKWAKQLIFNPNSSKQRIHLFHEVLGLPVTRRTKQTGQPSSDRDAIAGLDHPIAKEFVKLSENRKNLQFVQGYLKHIKVDAKGTARIHFPYNTCGTVSDRLGGFAPYILAAPFSEEMVMKPFKVSPGFEGIHADLSAIEPCLIAAYSEDPTLLKVHRDGLGDVYLDLGLWIFPDDKELHEGYNPNIPCTSEVKQRFDKIRKVCKIVHLAVGYTGTAFTVHKNLNLRGFPVSESDAAYYVNKYWEKFEKVSDLAYKLQELHKKQGYLRGILGRIIRIPEKFAKDTMNRLIQSSGHDILTAWVMEIDEMRKAQSQFKMVPLIPDTHDATSWEVEEGHFEDAKRIYEEALASLNKKLALPVTIRAEIKSFKTLAGLKGNE